jgi:hypothetical protein
MMFKAITASLRQALGGRRTSPAASGASASGPSRSFLGEAERRLLKDMMAEGPVWLDGVADTGQRALFERMQAQGLLDLRLSGGRRYWVISPAGRRGGRVH